MKLHMWLTFAALLIYFYCCRQMVFNLPNKHEFCTFIFWTRKWRPGEVTCCAYSTQLGKSGKEEALKGSVHVGSSQGCSGPRGAKSTGKEARQNTAKPLYQRAFVKNLNDMKEQWCARIPQPILHSLGFPEKSSQPTITYIYISHMLFL